MKTSPSQRRHKNDYLSVQMMGRERDAREETATGFDVSKT
jgi:hypothetical protein